MINWLVDQLLKLPANVALLFVFLLPALEASVFLGFLLPGETAVVVGGFLAYEGKLPIGLVIAVACIGAILGDSAGYEVGRRWGDALLNRAPKRFVKPAHVVQGKNLINRLGGKAVFAGRWTAVLRALVPSLCGTSRMAYRTFLAWNAAGGITWGVAFSLLGYLAGSAWQRVEGYTNTASYIIFGAALVLVIGFVLFNKRRQAKKDEETEAELAAEPEAAATASAAPKTEARAEAEAVEAAVAAPAHRNGVAGAAAANAVAGTAGAVTHARAGDEAGSGAGTSAAAADRRSTAGEAEQATGEPSEAVGSAAAGEATEPDPSRQA